MEHVETPTLLKITMEFEEYIQTLDGEEASKWLKSINGMIMLGYSHGIND